MGGGRSADRYAVRSDHGGSVNYPDLRFLGVATWQRVCAEFKIPRPPAP
jgi:hypothetical protein